MPTITSNMSLKTPTVGETDYATSVSDTNNAVDAHDHTSGKGVQIPTGGIVDLAVTTGKINDLAVTTGKVAALAITRAKQAAVGQQLSASSGTFSTSSTSATDVTNLSVSITTTGHPVVICLVGIDATGSALSLSKAANSATATIAIVRGATNVWVWEPTITIGGATSVALPISPGAIYHVDVPSANTYTYKVQVAVLDASTTIAFTNVKLMAYEL